MTARRLERGGVGFRTVVRDPYGPMSEYRT